MRQLSRIGLRLLLAAFTLLGAATAAFFALRLVPVDPAFVILGAARGDQVDISPEVLAAVRAEYGLNEPLLVQYGMFMGRLLQGDLGMSYVQQVPVTSLIASQVQPTLALAGLGTLLALVLSLSAAILTAGRRLPSGLASVLELTAASTPVFWLGFLLMLIFAVQLRALPMIDDGSLASLILPAVTIALPTAAPLAQVLRQSLEDVLEQPFITTARARGLSIMMVKLRHALRHAAIPYLTMIGFAFGALLGGAAITETLFSRPGLGRLLIMSVSNQDLPVVIGVVLLSTLAFVLVNTLVDIVYTLVDHRLNEKTDTAATPGAGGSSVPDAARHTTPRAQDAAAPGAHTDTGADTGRSGA